MDRSVAIKAAACQLALVAATSVVLALLLPKSFFEDWGWLVGPVGPDFDLYLRRWNGFSWVNVASSLSSSSNESITYNGTAGYYMWRIYSYSGSGSYNFWLDRP